MRGAVLGGSVVGFRELVTYEGPGDIVSGALGWWGTRAYSAAIIGQNAIRLRRDGVSPGEMDFVTVTGGGLDLASISTFKGGNNLFVVTLYDQSGNADDLTQSTAAQQPAFTLSGLGSLPVMTFTAADDDLLANGTGLAIPSAPMTLALVANKTNNGSIQEGINYTNPGPRIEGSGTADTWRFYNGSQVSTGATITDGSWHIAHAVFNGDSTSFLTIDGATTTGDVGAGVGLLPAAIGGLALVGGFGWNGKIVEGGVWDIGFSAGNIADMDTNASAYYGI